MVWGKILPVLLISIAILFIVPSVLAQNAPRGPLQGTFPQSGGHTCVPTGIAVLADTADIVTLGARRIASLIIPHCSTLDATSGTSIMEGVWGLIRGVLNSSTGGTTPGRNVTITIGGFRSMGGHTIIVNLTNGSHVNLVFVGVNLNASSLNATLTGSASGGSSSGSSSNPIGGSGCGGSPIGIGFKSAFMNEGHFVILVSIDTSEPITKTFGPGQGPFVGYPVVYWDPLTNSYASGWISQDGSYFDDGMLHGKLKDSISIK